MTGNNPPETASFWTKNSLVLKGALVLSLTLLLLIPKEMIEDIIRERTYRQQEAINEVGQKWATQQTLTGPVLTVPHYVYSRDAQDRPVRTIKRAYFMPEDLDIVGSIAPEKRNRGIYDITVYSSEMKLTGHFAFPDIEALNIRSEDVMWDDVSVNIGITDLRGIENALSLNWSGDKIPFNPGSDAREIISNGVRARVPLTFEDSTRLSQEIAFQIDLDLKGSQYLYFTPVGKRTQVAVNSPWADPSFSGAFIPDSRIIDEKHFEADWEVLHLNRNFPQQWTGGDYRISDSAFGVELLIPADGYQRSMRSVKYAILFIALTFLIFFFMEILNGTRVHPIQYTLIGLALTIFYTLLVSLSEQLSFNLAYLLSSGATISLVTFYVSYIFRERKFVVVFSGVLTLLYGFIFTIIQLQDFALLMGSIGLFVVIALLMYYSRKVDWYKAAAKA